MAVFTLFIRKENVFAGVREFRISEFRFRIYFVGLSIRGFNPSAGGKILVINNKASLRGTKQSLHMHITNQNY